MKKQKKNKHKTFKTKAPIFSIKKMSSIKLYSHQSWKLEILFMNLSFIESIDPGTVSPIIYLFLNCNTVNNFRDLIIENSPNLIIMEKSKEKIDKNVRIYLIMGSTMFLSHFLMTSMWTLSALRQKYNLKENYFTHILKQEKSILMKIIHKILYFIFNFI